MNTVESSTRDLLATILGKQASKIPTDVSMALLRSMHATEMVNQYRLSLPAAIRLAAALELGKRASGEPLVRGVRIALSADVWRHFGPRMQDLKVEQFWALHLDGKHRVQHEHLVSQGTLTSSPVHPREVFSVAVRHSAAALVLVHNHPSGDPSPSADDLEITRRLSEVGVTIGIHILDHVVVGDGNFVSLADRGLMGK